MASQRIFPPGPASSSQIDVSAMHRSLLSHKDKYGKISYFSLGGKNIVSLNTVDAIREALTSDDLMDRPLSFSQAYILANDIAVQPYSDDWLNLRKAMVAGINSIEELSTDMLNAQNAEFSALKKRIKDREGKEFDPREMITESVINGMIIGLVGRRFEYGHDIFRCFKQFDDCGRAIYGNPTANYILSTLPCLRFLPFWYGRTFRLTKEAIEGISRYLLRDTKGETDLSKKGLVYELLRIQNDDPTITDLKITSVILDMHIGGILTMSASLFSLLYQLLCHPDVQKTLHDEIDSIIGKDTKPTLDHIEKMPYAQAILLELFRFCPVLPGAVPRSNEKEAKICDYSLPADTIFIPNLFGINHDGEVWPDSWTFSPKRFLDKKGQLVPEEHPNRRNLVSFGDGRRACPGQGVARSRILLYFVTLLQSFDFTSDVKIELDSDPMKYTRDVILYPPVFKVEATER